MRDSLHLYTGDRIAFIVHGETEAVLKPVTRNVDQVFGLLQKPGQVARTVDDMDRAIVRRLRESHA